MPQASVASNETRLPRAILQRSKAIQDRLDAQRESKTAPADPSATPAPPDAAKAAPPVDPQPPAAVQPDARESDPLYWKQRFNVTSGFLRTEREARQAEVTGLHQRITELEGKLVESEAKATASPSSSKTDPGEYFTPEQIEQIGEEEATAIAAAAKKAAHSAAQAAVDKVTQAVAPFEQREARRIREEFEAKKQEFEGRLAEAVPNFKEIDESEGWFEWLAESDPDEGEQRQVTLTRYSQRLNAAGVAKMFKAYLKTVTPPPPPIAPHGQGANTGEQPAPQLNSKALRKPTDAEVRDFYKRAAIGRVSAQERVEFEARRKLRAPQ